MDLYILRLTPFSPLPALRLFVVSGAGILIPEDPGLGEAPSHHIEQAVAIDVVEVLAVVLEVVLPVRDQFPQGILFEVGARIPEFSGRDIEYSVAVNVANVEALIVVLVQLLDTPLQAALFRMLSVDAQCSEVERENGREANLKEGIGDLVVHNQWWRCIYHLA